MTLCLPLKRDGAAVTAPERPALRHRTSAWICLQQTCIVALLVLLLAALAPAAALAEGPGSRPDTGRSIIEIGDEAVVRPQTIVDHVYAIGGDAIVAGVVQHDVVVIGGDVVLFDSAIVHENVVCIGGRVERHPGAVVLGSVDSVSSDAFRSIARWTPMRPVVDPLSGSSLLGWAVSTLVYMGLAAAVAAAAPRQVEGVADRLRSHPWSSLGWGLVAAFVIVPIVSVVLFATVVGIALLVPWLLALVPSALIAGYVASCLVLGRLVLGASRRPATGRVVATATGALALGLLRLIPYAGGAAWFAAWLVGFGAASTLIWLWLAARRERRSRTRSRGDATTTPT
jgi:hypothetical protein